MLDSGRANRQFWACARALFDLPSNIEDETKEDSSLQSQINAWGLQLYSDIEDANHGYPKKEVHDQPYLEQSLSEIILYHWPKVQRFPTTPTLYLTHDIDYLFPTIPGRLKRILGRRDFRSPRSRGEYLESLRGYLELDQRIGGPGVSTLFAALPGRASGLKKRFKQWLVDPSYTTKSPEFDRFRELVHEFDVEVGIHGSILSLEEGLFEGERQALGSALGKPISYSRQHWLHIPNSSSLDLLARSGISVDSSLSWNGHCGFRCGFARPFPLVLESGASLFEVPLVVMDGILFDELGLDESGALEKAKEVLQVVFEEKGGAAINWHGRSWASDYGWGDVYKELLSWCKAKGFVFGKFSDIPKNGDN